MAISRSLLLKCLGGVAACFGTASLGIVGSGALNSGNVSSESETELNNLLKKVGLSACTTTKGVECTIGSPFNVQQGTTKEEGKSKGSSSGTQGKIKVYKESSDTNYNKGFKFLIEDGDINLGGSSSSISKLEEFETYEIKQDETDNSKWYFSRKKTSAENIRETLGLPNTCTLGASVNCSEKEITTSEIASMKFDGVSGTPSSNGTVKLTVTKETTDTSKYPLGYKFTFKANDSTSSVNLTLGSKTVTLGTNEEVEFKIKKSGSSLSLEESGSLSIYLEKVGLSVCTVSGGTECSIVSGSLKVQQGSTKEEGKSKQDGSSGKIKVYKENSTDNYFKGYRFEIEEGDITLTGGAGTISELKQYETYEIKEESGNWYFSRKKTAEENIKDKLGLPTGCNLDSCSEVEVDTSAIASMKFEGVTGTPSSTGTIKLTVSKETSNTSDYPLGYKFELKGKDNSVTLTLEGNNTITLQQDTATEFRIKKGTSGNTLTLEEAWSLENLLKKVSLSACTTTNGTGCTIGSSFNVEQGSNKETNKTQQSDSSETPGKIKVYRENSSTTYNKGFKFLIEDGDINLGGSSSSITKLEEFETYEIKKEDNGNNWYFSRKKTAAENIRDTLGLPSECNIDSSCSEKEIDTSAIASMKFDGVSGNPSSTGAIKLTVTKLTTTDPDYPLDYKFELKSKENSATLTLGSKTITLRQNEATEFKIKKGTSGNTLTLEKAWTAKTLGAKVGLDCPEQTTENSDKKCTFTDGSINVKNDDTKITNGKLGEGSSSKKMSYQEDQEGYNQGFKFYLEESEDITLTNSTGGSDDAAGNKKIHKKGDNGTETYYEIKKDESDSKWYLTKKITTGGGS